MTTFSKTTNRAGAILLILGALLGAAAAPASATSGKASFDNSALELAPGESATIHLNLSEPVICAGPGPCSVTLDLSSAFPAGITAAPNSITFDSANWFTSQTVVIAVDQSATLTGGEPIVSTAAFTGGSEFYLGYVPALSVTLPAPIADVPELAYSSGLAETGETPWFAIVGAILTASGAALAFAGRRRS
ncbi:MAG: hypothetical protein ORN27_08625 [Rhodoluna sp.]|nr:hypothetical protein [Rhodoluna sp.]